MIHAAKALVQKALYKAVKIVEDASDNNAPLEDKSEIIPEEPQNITCSEYFFQITKYSFH